MRSAEYWRSRFVILEEAAHARADQCAADLEIIFREAEQQVQADIERWYGRFAENNQISLIEARRLLNGRELEEFRWNVRQYIEVGQRAGLSPEWQKRLENASARFHISRLEAVQVQIQQQLELLYGGQTDSIDRMLREVAGNGYTYTAYEIQRGLGVGWDIVALDQRRLELLLSRPWTADNRTFRDRCWEHKANLVSGVQSVLTQGLLRGDSLHKMTSAMQRKFQVSRYKAGRLVHTETTYFNAAASYETYKDLGVEQVEILETLDNITCGICGEFDGMVIPLAQYEPGVTVPPFHPNCRGTTCPHISDADGKRIARDADGKTYYVPADISYAEWRGAFVDGGDKSGLREVGNNGIIKENLTNEVSAVHYVGKLDKDIYSCVTSDIATDAVVITDERIRHIKERHPGDFERYVQYMQEIVQCPDYILEGNKPNTALVLKSIEENGKKYKMIIRLRTSADPTEYQNSIITFQKVENRRYARYTKSNKMLYKRE